ncbi:hypothetical protein CYMTET_56967 [Cymbomonas tetramitiformis]|uniref:Uncharacterized protein n=1 Tax=Cymbomonas tetramitiformis TaxID=36881 RepID=A0AAE0BAA8_9CHLO|nr:hypothetical protein CYMTET_56967 [Cymbomonas tetramitiformis]
MFVIRFQYSTVRSRSIKKSHRVTSQVLNVVSLRTHKVEEGLFEGSRVLATARTDILNCLRSLRRARTTFSPPFGNSSVFRYSATRQRQAIRSI